MGEFTLSKQKESFSKAYAHAVGAAAGFVVEVYPQDYGSVDMMFSAPGLEGTNRSPYLAVQCKCTAEQPIDDRWLSFDLPVKNYNDLRLKENVAKILVVMVVPKLTMEWLEHGSESIALLRCAYWKSLLGQPETSNTSTVAITMDRQNIFTVNALQGIMNRLAQSQNP